MRSRETAEELVQELFLSLWRHRHKWQLSRSLRSYLFGALRNHIVSYRRSRQAVNARNLAEEYSDSGLDLLPSRDGSDDRARESELREAIHRAINALSPRCRETFLLVRQQNLSYAEAAEVLGISNKAVEMNMLRALASLRKQLAPWRE